MSCGLQAPTEKIEILFELESNESFYSMINILISTV